MNLEDTIAAISTPLGEGGIGIVRLSGKNSIAIASKLFSSPKSKTPEAMKSHSIIFGYIVNPEDGAMIDEVLLSIMRGPNTYTKEDIVEINCHSGMAPLNRVLELTLKSGARLAAPGEFTFRAFMNGRIDLSQAEATLDLIRAKTEESSRIAVQQVSGSIYRKITSLRNILVEIYTHIEAYIDFPEEELKLQAGEEIQEKVQNIISNLQDLSSTYEEGRYYRMGASTAIVGKPNVGKSSLLNALLERERAIVTEFPGTTRDIIEEYLNINGLPIRIMDTAGIREPHNLAESEGVKRSLEAIDRADLTMAVFDISIPLNDEDFSIIKKIINSKSILILNKSDLPHKLEEHFLPNNLIKIKISAKTGERIELLKDVIKNTLLKSGISLNEVVITNLRHKLAIDNTINALTKASNALQGKYPYEIIAFELRDALDRFGEIVGQVTTEDILNKIFSDFCIGK